MSFKSSIVGEFMRLSQRPKYAEQVSQTLKYLLLIESGETKRKNKIRKICNLKKGALSSVTDESLLKLYFQICQHLNSSRPFETGRPSSEQLLYSFIKKNVRRRIMHSIWIGNHNIDIFLPTMAIIVEVNGPIHNGEPKMRKDNHRDMRLMDDLGIVVVEIPNEVIRERKYLFKELGKMKHIGTLKHRAMWRKIAIETIASQCELGFLSHVFGYNFEALIKEL